MLRIVNGGRMVSQVTLRIAQICFRNMIKERLYIDISSEHPVEGRFVLCANLKRLVIDFELMCVCTRKRLCYCE
jgi:hypothetical protein